jgi:hypothetical protein
MVTSCNVWKWNKKLRSVRLVSDKQIFVSCKLKWRFVSIPFSLFISLFVYTVKQQCTFFYSLFKYFKKLETLLCFTIRQQWVALRYVLWTAKSHVCILSVRVAKAATSGQFDRFQKWVTSIKWNCTTIRCAVEWVDDLWLPFYEPFLR